MLDYPFDLAEEKAAILAEGSFGALESKFAAAMLRYRSDRAACVIDSENAGRTAQEAIGIGGNVPVVASLEEALRLRPTLLVIGIAPPGGALPDSWCAVILSALRHGLHLMSGLHQFLALDAEFAEAAGKSGARIWDLRRPPENLPVGRGRALRLNAKRVLTVGSDCRVGKMVAALEMNSAAAQRGWKPAFCATGQIGIMLSGAGIAVDAVVADFISGAAERILLERFEAVQPDWLFVEGQGSLTHPSYSGVTLGLLHGAAPNAMVLCHQPSRRLLARFDLPIPPLHELVSLYETAAGWLAPAPVAAVALNTFDLSDEEARAAVEDAERQTCLPATDPIRFGADKLLDALQEALP